MTDKSKIRDRIRNLKQKTADRGCTEAEAMAAAGKAAQLMRDHGISDLELEVTNASSKSRSKGHAAHCRLWGAIGHYTNTEAIIQSRGKDVQVVFFGKEPGPEIAVYLRDVLERAIRRELREFQKSRIYRLKRSVRVKQKLTHDFTTGMVQRLISKLDVLFASNVKQPDQDLAKQAVAECYNNLEEIKSRKRASKPGEALFHGFEAGGNVELGHGLSSQSPQARIAGGVS